VRDTAITLSPLAISWDNICVPMPDVAPVSRTVVGRVNNSGIIIHSKFCFPWQSTGDLELTWVYSR
jgi:hypothetical protein